MSTSEQAVEPVEPKKTDGLAQADIDAIFNAIQAEQAERKTVRPYGFHKPDYLSSDKLRRLRNKHDSLIHELNASLSLFLRKEVSLRITRLETITHAKLLETLPENSHLTLFHFNPLVGTGVIEITPQLGLTIVARMLGSQGHSINSERDLTEIDVKLLDRFVDVILRDYVSMWRIFEPQLTWVIDSHEHSSRFMKLAADPDTIMIFLVMEARFGSTTGFIRMSLPYLTLEGCINKLSTPPQGTTIQQETHKNANLVVNEPVMDVPVRIEASWSGLRMTVSELKKLQKDDIFVLDQDISSKTGVYIGNILKFYGQVGRKGDRLAVRVNSKAS
jgi:flagellar motor switch protein FliM